VPRFFNTAGPNNPADHYTLPVPARLPDVRGLITRDEVGELYGQHTAETGQVFLPEAVDRAYHLTQGQPWLVNALARQLIEVLVKDRTQAIAATAVDEAKEILIRRQDTHLDSRPARRPAPDPGDMVDAGRAARQGGAAARIPGLLAAARRAAPGLGAERLCTSPVTTPGGRRVTLIRA
jgi:hypothetical protein